MKKPFLLSLCLFMLIGRSFSLQTGPGGPITKPEVILKNMDNFNDYISLHFFKLYQDLTAYNEESKVISKREFLEKLTTGHYLPLRLSSADNKLYYRLYRFRSKAFPDMGDFVKSYSEIFLAHYKLAGKKFPAFNFVDIKGNRYNAATTKGKTIVLKCWYIGCVRCEQEMPELNKLVALYKNRKDVVFISLAFDSKPKLEAFLKRKQFDYPIVASQRSFMSNTLGVKMFPTHYVINKQGTIVSVVDGPEEISYVLKNKI
jgi:peroxiredoxin